jgi:hypothetical protein
MVVHPGITSSTLGVLSQPVKLPGPFPLLAAQLTDIGISLRQPLLLYRRCPVGYLLSRLVSVVYLAKNHTGIAPPEVAPVSKSSGMISAHATYSTYVSVQFRPCCIFLCGWLVQTCPALRRGHPALPSKQVAIGRSRGVTCSVNIIVPFSHPTWMLGRC